MQKIRRFSSKSHEVSVKEALTWTFVWVFLALIFNIIIYFWRGQQRALEYFTGYMVEKALSVDNIFVFIMIFSYSKYLQNISTKFFSGVFSGH